MGFINDDQIPIHLRHVRLFRASELVGANHDGRLNEGVQIPLLDLLLESSRFENGRWQEEFVRKLLTPLLAEICRDDDQQFAVTFSPPLGEEDTGFDRLPSLFQTQGAACPRDRGTNRTLVKEVVRKKTSRA
jgi:hypothetical protein